MRCEVIGASAHLGADFLLRKTKKEPCILQPLYQEIPADCETPVSLFAKLSSNSPAYLLESAEGGEHLARYSFLGFAPFAVLRAKNGRVEILEGKQRTILKRDPLTVLAQIFEQFQVLAADPLPPFLGGVVGYFGYDLSRYYERLPYENEDDIQVPDCYLVFSRAVIVFDHSCGTVKIIVLAEKDGGCEERKGRVLLRQLERRVLNALRRPCFSPKHFRKTARSGCIQSNMSKEQFLAKIDLAKRYIEAGDIFQVVVSQRFKVPFQGDSFLLYRVLRRMNPSPYMFYLNFPEMQIIGSSPEVLLKRQGDLLITRPLAGTRPRGKAKEEDFQLEKELRSCPKERAEHVMLVDLGRNDLGRVCRYGSISAPVFLEVERYSHVMHLVSEVRGCLDPEKTVFDAFKAVFPAGTVSGAPKIRAMEIIEELEPHRRGVYAGAVGYLSFSGNFDTCIAIRTILVKDGYFYAQAGAGIVADSQPEREYEETCNKAAALFAALNSGSCARKHFFCGGRASW